MKNHIDHRALLFLLSVCFTLIAGCSKDEKGGGPSSGDPIENNALRLSFDIITATYLTAANPDEAESLTVAEQQLRVPRMEGWQVDYRILEDGVIHADLVAKAFPGMPEFPANMVGREILPEAMQVTRIEVRNGQYSFFNADGELLGTGAQDLNSLAYLQQLVQDLPQSQRVSEEHFALVLQAYAEAGFDVRDVPSNPRFAELRQSFADGGSTILYIDKDLQVIDSRVNSDAAGVVETITDYTYVEDGDLVRPIAYRFMSFYDSPFTELRMCIHRVSEIQSFSIQKNPQ